MARPQLRYSLRVLQAPKQSWTFSSKPTFSVKEAAVQLFGPEIATYCFEKTFEISSSTDSNDASVKQQGRLPDCKYVFEAFILKKDSCPSKFSKQRYFSVDGRPVTAKRGTLKKLLDIYVEHISVLSRRDTSTTRPKDYFIRLNIKCPPGSYDANVEASKDDVVFSDEKIILDGFKDLCKEVYKVSPPSRLHSQSPTAQNSAPASSDNLRARKPLPRKPGVKSSPNEPHCLSPSAQTTSQPIIEPSPQRYQSPVTSQSSSPQLEDADQHAKSPGSTRVATNNIQTSFPQALSAKTQSRGYQLPNSGLTRCGIDMPTDFNEESHDRLQKRPSRPSQASHILYEKPDRATNSAPQDVNPWIISKMNAPNRSHIVGKQPRNEPAQRSSSPLPEFESVMIPEPPILRHTGAAPRDLDVPPSQRYLDPQSPLRRLQPKVPGGPYRSPMSSPPRMTPRNTMGSTSRPSTMKPRRYRNTLPWSPPSSVEAPVLSENRLATTRNEPIADSMKQTTISFTSTGRGRKRQLQEYNSTSDYQGSHGSEYQRENWFQYMPILAKDNSSYKFSLQQMPHALEQKQHQVCVNPDVTEDQPHVKLRKIGLEDGANSSGVVEPIRTTLASDDPRTYLLRRQKSMAIEREDTKLKKLRRLNSSLLPLENVPPNEQTHSLALVEVWNTDTLRIYVRKYATYDGYVTKGLVENGIEMSLDEGRSVEKRLKSIFLKQPGAPHGEEAVPKINICSLLKGKGVNTSL
ncbi:hypothetical protein F4811DRAFT_511068 [Daldinia bambusicola]|nr:hypothetical protein F4811DRAFT_511068 [Daldinia bambusicola]